MNVIKQHMFANQIAARFRLAALPLALEQTE